MSMSRAEAVAEILWELKRADKLGTFTEIAHRAGFNPGANGRTMLSCLKLVRKDWPHLQWFRAIDDDLRISKGSEQEVALKESGYPLEETDDQETLVLANPEETLLNWSAVEAQ
ncbi:hypothetical protein [Rubinisphaera margarita]|uniref:hypothetical protein n=1 Tax=Rubinisphaera margarita TaxID=2909586 RepID=UPI001EE78A67|nr:hypothetical protein [Rubinisphaera margarita]MCG6157882.1 hypothetical protein [Rubinisphaera margarita]